jgi:hypothetical protein
MASSFGEAFSVWTPVSIVIDSDYELVTIVFSRFAILS